MADSEDTVESLTRLGMITSGATIQDIVSDFPDWKRLGGECFGLPFTLTTTTAEGEAADAKFILKACITMSAPSNPEGPSFRLLARRKQLEENDIPAPQLYAYKSATFLEEFIGQSIKEAFPGNREAILEQAASYYGTMSRLGYKPIQGYLRDYRWDGQKLVGIDFGADLGPPSNEPTSLWEIFQKEAKAELGVPAEEIANYRQFYDNTSGSTITFASSIQSTSIQPASVFVLA